eukprot:363545-Chlamydomonas_euryale.AAC.5
MHRLLCIAREQQHLGACSTGGHACASCPGQMPPTPHPDTPPARACVCRSASYAWCLDVAPSPWHQHGQHHPDTSMGNTTMTPAWAKPP